MAEDTGFVALRRGLLEMLVLAAVEKKPRYAAEIMEALRKVHYPVQEGTVYPLLNKLRRANLVEHEWQESPTGPPRKYLSLTPEGKQRLSEFQSYWQELTAMIEGVKE